MKALHLQKTCPALALLVWAAAAQAQYKVVLPDGSITYTDRPPTASNARITSMARVGNRNPPADPGLPLELRSAVQRNPVTLYTSADCQPCDAGRKLLQTRGVPYSEKRVSTEDDAAALERLVGARSIPALTIGPQPLRGFSETDWAAYLDVAGYPRDNKLPRGWQPPEVTALVERATPSARAQAPSPPPRNEPRSEDVPEPAPTGNIRF